MEVINYALFILTVAMLIITVIQYYKQILKKNQEVLLITKSSIDYKYYTAYFMCFKFNIHIKR